MNAYRYGTGEPVAHADHNWEQWHAYLEEPDASPSWVGGDASGICCHTCRLIVVDSGVETLELVCTIGTCPEIAEEAHSPCCSSHGRALCCEHYGRTHFCVGACSPDSHADAAMAAACAREPSRSGCRR